ncbi:MAG: penicillin-binding protein [Candidatus Curtissbacteria bacterium]|nr:penicillin-binding protein [Candidatus Curtissbacteria bacterium]
MKFSTYGPRRRKFSSRFSKLPNLSTSQSHQNHPFVHQSSFNRRKFWVKFSLLISTAVFFSLIAMMIFTVFSFVIFAKDLPSPNKLSARDSSLSTKIYDRNGKLMYDIFADKNRALVKWNELPPYVKQATISIEDKDFYDHQGFSPFGFLRAAVKTLVFRDVQGGSTITQQVVKNTLLSSERTLTRKIKEFILAIQVERKYTKDEILQIYLNEVPYGGTSWGIEAASQTYFNKEAKDLTLPEAVILAGLPQQPSYYSPYGTTPNAYIARAESVARRMREDGHITKEQEEELKKQIPEVKFSPNDHGIEAPHFVFHVKDLLVEKYGEKLVEQGGLKVTTTLDLELQNKAQQIVAEEVEKVANLSVGNGAAVVMDPKNGEILSMVGSKDYFAENYDGQVNVTTRLRQPGSALKPFTYATAFKAGYTPSFVLMDVPTEFPGGTGQPAYKPVNYDGKYRGPMQIRFALGNSENVPAVKMLGLVGVKNMLRTAYDSGLTTLEPTSENLQRFGLAVTLGGGDVRLLDLVNGYATLANKGVHHAPVAILKVEDRSGKVLEEKKDDDRGKEVLGEDVSFLISHILSDNVARTMIFGPNSLLNIPGKTVAVKTGTTDDKRDNWAVGYTPSTVVGVWVGNNDNSQMNPQIASGVTGATPIWNRIMSTALEGKGNEGFNKPGNVNAMEVDAFSGGLPCRDFPKRSEYFVKGTEPTRDCLAQKNLDGREYYVFLEFDPVSADGRNRWQEGIDAWAQAQPDEKYRVPAELKNEPTKNPEDIKVNISKPSDHSQVDFSFETEANVETGKKVTKVEFYIDGSLKDSKGSSPYKFSYSFNTSNKGKHKIKVKAFNDANKDAEKEIEVSVGEPWN